jgi:hypothetical protein
MFLRYIDFIFVPFRAIQNKIIGVKNIKGNIKVDVNRAKALVGRGKEAVGRAGQYNNQLNQWGQPQQPQQGAQMQQQAGQPPGMPGMPPPGMPGMPPGGQGPNPNPPIITKGFWIFKKKFCSQCEQQLDKSWDQCPYCRSSPRR